MKNKKSAKKITGSSNIVLAGVTVVVLFAFFMANNNFLTFDNIKNIMNSMSFSGVLTIGMAMLLIGGEVDLSSGSIACLCGLLMAVMINAGVPWGLAIVITLVIGAVIGYINSLFINKLGFLSFIATLGLMSVYQGIVDLVSRSKPQPITVKGVEIIGTIKIFGIPFAFVIFIVLLVIYAFILSNTRFGRTIYLVGGNKRAARLCGIDPKRISTLLYVNNGFLCAVAGIVFTARMHTASPVAGQSGAVNAITAAVLGGVSFIGGSGTMVGCFIGVILLNCLSAGFVAVGFPSYLQLVAKGLLLVAALALDFFTTKARKKELEASL